MEILSTFTSNSEDSGGIAMETKHCSAGMITGCEMETLFVLKNLSVHMMTGRAQACSGKSKGILQPRFPDSGDWRGNGKAECHLSAAGRAE